MLSPWGLGHSGMWQTLRKCLINLALTVRDYTRQLVRYPQVNIKSWWWFRATKTIFRDLTGCECWMGEKRVVWEQTLNTWKLGNTWDEPLGSWWILSPIIPLELQSRSAPSYNADSRVSALKERVELRLIASSLPLKASDRNQKNLPN